MIKHTELETKQKLHKLETVMNDTEIGSDFENHQEEKQYNQQKQNKKRSHSHICSYSSLFLSINYGF